MLQKLGYFLLAEIALCAGGYAMTLHFPEWSSAVWFGICGSAILGIIFLWLHERYWVKPRVRVHFDMPILAAIEHMMQTVPHSWDSPDKAERFFFRAIHKQMKAGRLRVMGAEAPGGEVRRIRKKQLSSLTPVPTNVPESETTPYGVRFDLIDEAKLGKPRVQSGSFPGFFDLRLRSKDLYRLWPRTRSQDGGGA